MPRNYVDWEHHSTCKYCEGLSRDIIQKDKATFECTKLKLMNGGMSWRCISHHSWFCREWAQVIAEHVVCIFFLIFYKPETEARMGTVRTLTKILFWSFLWEMKGMMILVIVAWVIWWQIYTAAFIHKIYYCIPSFENALRVDRLGPPQTNKHIVITPLHI